MAESGGLENRCRGNPPTVGSNPTPSVDDSYVNPLHVGVACGGGEDRGDLVLLASVAILRGTQRALEHRAPTIMSGVGM